MTGRPGSSRADASPTLPVIERLTPAPPAALLTARIDAHTSPGDVVADLAGRGGWVARAALDRQRRAISIESMPLTQMLAEVVLRPPDVRHLDAALQGLGASPHRQSNLKSFLADLFATRCPTCGRMLVLDEMTWTDEGDDAPRPVSRLYRCTVCRHQRGSPEQRQVPLDDEDQGRARAAVEDVDVRALAADRFPVIDRAPFLVDELLALHTPRQLVALVAILERIEGDLRAAPVLAALRLAFLHAVLPSSRLATTGGNRNTALRMRAGHVRVAGGTWRERNPWLAFEEAFALVRGFVQGLDGGALGPLPARLGEDLRSLGEGSATTVLSLAGPSAMRALRDQTPAYERLVAVPRIRLVLGQPPPRPSRDRLLAAYHGTAWALGREAAGLLPLAALSDPLVRAPWAWQARSIRRSLDEVQPSLARDGRVIQVVEDGPEALAAAAVGGASARYRLVVAHLRDPDDDIPGVVEFVPPGAPLPPGPRTRANLGLEPVPGGSGDPELVPARGLFAPPERLDERPFSAMEAARVMTEIAVETLQARGEPTRFERLFGEILVGLDRAGQLRRLVRGSEEEAAGSDASVKSVAADQSRAPGDLKEPAREPVERLLALIREELGRPSQRRLTEIEPGRWWLADRTDREAAATPLADRVEWAVFSLLSTAGPLSEAAFRERMAALFTGHDRVEGPLVQACLDSYRSTASTADRLVTNDELIGRSHEHTALLAAIADAGHRLGMQVWLSAREQTRRHEGRTLGDRLTDREREANLGGISRALEDLEAVDALWYRRGKVTFLFEVEWTAILGETMLRRHARIGNDERMVRFLVIAPERTELVRHKLDRSPLLRTALADGGWHVLKWDHLRTFVEADRPDLAALEPLLGLDPIAEQTDEQLLLFDASVGSTLP